MGRMEGVRAGIAEMRATARRLNQWADDLEASFQNREASEEKVDAGNTAETEKEKEASSGRTPAEPAADEKKGKALTLPEVRAVLAEKCAAGFGTQVKALIESYGAVSLKDVPADKYGELLETAALLGGEADAG